MKKFAIALAALGAAMVPGYASATTTLMFEGQSNTVYSAPITRSFFNIGNPAGQEQHFHEIDSTQFSLISNGTGVLLNDRDTQIFITAVGGGSFTLTSFDIASSGGANLGGNTFTVTGFLGALQVGSVSGNLGQSFSTVAGFGNTAIDRVIFDGFGGGGGFELDNVVLNGNATPAVPEPSTWALMLLGFGAAGYGLRRRKTAVLRTA